MPKRPYPRYQRRHHAILLSICRDPSKKQKDIAKETGYSESQVSRILCSPEFHEAWNDYKDRLSNAWRSTPGTDPSAAMRIERQAEQWRHGR
jgi:hypothetical protein